MSDLRVICHQRKDLLDGAVVVRADGVLAMDTADEFLTSLSEGVTHARNVDVRVVAGQNRIVRTVMGVTGVDGIVAMYASLPDALQPSRETTRLRG